MSLQFNVEEFIRPLVSEIYNSSDEDMEVDILSGHEEQLPDDGPDSDIEIIACYREVPVFPPQLVGGRAMTTDFDTDESNLTQSQYGRQGSVASITDPSDSLIEWFVGNPPQQTYKEEDPRHKMAQCKELEPIHYSPLSPPLHEQGPSAAEYYGEYPEEQGQESEWIRNPHISGMTISARGICGTPNLIQYGGCAVCGKSYATIQEEITLGYLEKTHIPEENYVQRVRRRNAFQAGMRAGSVILVPGGVSQAAACDGNYYQIPSVDDLSNPPPGVLPI